MGDMFIDNVKMISKAAGIPFGELEQRIGVARGYFSRVIRRKSAYTSRTVNKAAEILDVPAEFLISRQEKDDIIKLLIDKSYYDSIKIKKMQDGTYDVYIQAGGEVYYIPQTEKAVNEFILSMKEGEG